MVLVYQIQKVVRGVFWNLRIGDGGATQWGTHRRRRISLPEHHPLLRERIEVGGLHRRWLVDVITLHILPSDIIG